MKYEVQNVKYNEEKKHLSISYLNSDKNTYCGIGISIDEIIDFAKLQNKKGIIQPLFNRVVIEPIEVEDVAFGNIIMPDTVQNTPRKGKVVASGEDCRHCKVGDLVLRHQDAGDHLIIEGKQYLIMAEADVYAII